MRITVGTKIIYVVTSSDILETRFIYDIAHCVLFLTMNKAVDRKNQIIVTDTHKDEFVKLQPFFADYEFISSPDIYGFIRSVDCENLFILSSCHGGLYGIDAKEKIRPFQLTQSIKENVYIKNCVVFFGQCYAGAFNHIDITCAGKEIVYIGATEMRKGFSTVQTWKLTKDITWTWAANIFIFFLANWFNNPEDVDNDGLCSIVDLYKYLCYHTNLQTEDVEKEEAMKFWEEKIKLEIGKVVTADADTKKDMEDLDEEAAKELDYYIPHQDCWILNAGSAMKIIIES